MSRPPRANGRTVRLSGPHVHPSTASQIRARALVTGETMDGIAGDVLESAFPPYTPVEDLDDPQDLSEL